MTVIIVLEGSFRRIESRIAYSTTQLIHFYWKGMQTSLLVDGKEQSEKGVDGMAAS